MPPSARGKAKTRGGRRAPATADPQEPSDAETPEAIQTPSRTSRKRTRGGGDSAAPVVRNTRRKVKDTRMQDQDDTDGTDVAEHSDNETDPATPSEQEIISALRVADRHVNATYDFPTNALEGQDSVPGYGKIAGRDWVFIIRKIEVNIGRPETQDKLTVTENGNVVAPTSKTVIDIDLGPDRQISRLHAIISYDSVQLAWLLVVNGRNGVRVDDTLLKRGSQAYLRNGSVIDIAGTQMAFITTSTNADEGPIWHENILKQAQKSSEDDDDGTNEGPTNGQQQQNHSASRDQMPGAGSHDQSTENGSQQQRNYSYSQRAAGPPGTPIKSQQSFNKSSPAANYSRGVMMESTESIDYSADSAKDLKPPHSYAQLIGMAILSTPEQTMTLNNIYQWIMANYAFYRFNTHGWQNSIRHNLSLNKAFTKIARRTDEPGKGMKWMIEPTEFDTFVQQGMKGCRRPNPLPSTQSHANSPSSPIRSTKLQPDIKQDVQTTPPLASYRPAYPIATEAYTPDRGSKVLAKVATGLGIHHDGPEFDYARSTPKNGMTAAANAAGSPPALYVNDDGRVGPLDTPFPIRPSQRLAPPSTLKRPSDFIQFSSPAPFWKMEGLVESTPFKPYDLSPLKTPFPGFGKANVVTKKDPEASSPIEDKIDIKEDDEVKKKMTPPIEPSSPPQAHESSVEPDASPSTLSRPATAVAKALSQLANSHSPDTKPEQLASPQVSAEPLKSLPTSEVQESQSSISHPALNSSMTSMGNHFPSPNLTHGSYGLSSQPRSVVSGFAAPDDDDDEGIDLAKGFQPIGTYHQRNHMVGMGVASGRPSFGR